MTLPRWIARTATALALSVAAVFAIATTFVALVMPYRFWDSLAFSSWSRSIAETGELWANTNALSVSRPLFYVPQGLLWRHVSDDEWVGRSLSAGFAVVLVVSIWFFARRLTEDRVSRALLPPLAVLAALSSSVFATFVAAGMTDVPVAAATAATALVLWSRLPARFVVPLAAVGACATILAKPSGLLALVGLAVAAWVLAGRASLPDLGGIAVGAVVAVGYDAWQASRLDVSLSSLLRAGNDDFWLARADAARLDALAGGDWLGDGARLVIVLGLAYGVGRASAAEHASRSSLATAVALAWSVAGPLVADGSLGYPFDASVLGIVGWLGVAAGLACSARSCRRGRVVATHVRRTSRLARTGRRPLGVAAARRGTAPCAGMARTRAPRRCRTDLRIAGPPPPAPSSRDSSRPRRCRGRRTLECRRPSTASAGRVGAIFSTSAGRAGASARRWRTSRSGPSRTTLHLARENVAAGDRDRLERRPPAVLLPGQGRGRYARTCAELDGARFFSFLTSGESLELRGARAAADRPARAGSSARAHRSSSSASRLGSTPRSSSDSHARAADARRTAVSRARRASSSTPYSDATSPTRTRSRSRPERSRSASTGRGSSESAARRSGSSSPASRRTATVQDEFARQAEGVGLPVEYEDAVRYPEVAADVPPVAARVDVRAFGRSRAPRRVGRRAVWRAAAPSRLRSAASASRRLERRAERVGVARRGRASP